MARSAQGRFGWFSRVAVSAMTIALLVMSGGCSSVGSTESQYVKRMTDSLGEAADGVDQFCGAGSAEAQAARDAATNVNTKLGAFQLARNTVNSAKSTQSNASTKIADLNKEIQELEQDIAVATPRMVERMDGNYRGYHIAVEDSDSSNLHKLLLPTGLPGSVQKNTDNGKSAFDRINQASGATDAEKAQAQTLINELNFDLANAKSVSAATYGKLGSGSHAGNQEVIDGFCLLLALVEKTKIAMSKLQIIERQVEVRRQQDRMASAATTEATAQADYDTAKSELDAALGTATAAQNAATAKAEECATAQGITPPPWPRSPTWQSTFWDISS